MRQLTTALAIAAICLALGCKEKTSQPEEATRFEAAIDGPTCVLTVHHDENLLKDQRQLARQAGSVVTEGGPTATPSSAPASKPVDTTPEP